MSDYVTVLLTLYDIQYETLSKVALKIPYEYSDYCSLGLNALCSFYLEEDNRKTILNMLPTWARENTQLVHLEIISNLFVAGEEN